MRRVPLAVTGPLPARPMLAALAAHSLPGVQETDLAAGTVQRLLEIDGRRVPVTVLVADDTVTLEAPRETGADVLAGATRSVRRWLDLDHDPAVVHAALGSDPLLGPLLETRPGLRIVGHPDPFEAAVTTVLGQRVSLAAARVLAERFCDAFPPSTRSGSAQPTGSHAPALRPFPEPGRVAGVDPDALRAAIGTTATRARAVVALARAVADGLDLTAGAGAEVRAVLLAIPGIGPWTVEYLAVRVLGDRDAFPSGDLVLQRALGVTSAREADRIAESWRPWRAYALLHLWTHASYDPPERA